MAQYSIIQKISRQYKQCFRILRNDKWIIYFIIVFFIISSVSGVIYQAMLLGSGPFEPLDYHLSGWDFYEQFSHIVATNIVADLLKIMLGIGFGVGPTIGIHLNAFHGYDSVYNLYVHNGPEVTLALYFPFVIIEDIAGILSTVMGFKIFLSLFKKRFRKKAMLLSLGLGTVIYPMLVFELGFAFNAAMLLLAFAFVIPLIVMICLTDRKAKFWGLNFSGYANKKEVIAAFKEALIIYVFIIIPIILIAALIETNAILIIPAMFT